MSEVIPISEAKANLSKLVKRAQAGEVIYLGAYGHAEAILAPVPRRRSIAIGIWQERRVPGYDYESDDLVGPDLELDVEWQNALDRVETVSR